MKLKNKIINIYLLTILFIFPLLVFARSENDVPYGMGIFTGLFISIHLCGFTLFPLARKISPDNSKILSIIFAVCRIIYVFIMNALFPNFLIVDFLLVWCCCMFSGVIVTIVSAIKSSDNTVVSTSSNEVSFVSPPSFTYVCSKCGKDVRAGAKFCPDCGGVVNQFTHLPEIKKICPNCNIEYPKENKFCAKCGSSLALKEISVDNEYIINNAAIGTPINMSDYDPILVNSFTYNIASKYVEKELSKDPNYSGKTLPKLENRKLLMTFIYSIILALFILLYAAYHTNLAIIILLAIILTIIYFILLKTLSIKKYIVKEVKSRPDEKIEYIVASTMSGAVNNKIFGSLLRIICIVVVLAITIYLFKDPHLVYEKDKTNGGYALRYYTIGLLNPDSELEVPSKYKGENVVSIRGDVFENVYTLKKVKLPDTIVEIRGGAFQGCTNLEYINLPPKITEIKGSTFENCYSLESIVIPEGVTRIGGSAFRDCSSLSEAEIPKTVNEIGSSAFRGTALNKVCISKNASVNERAFKETSAVIAYYENGCNVDYYSGDDYNYGYGNGNTGTPSTIYNNG